MCPCYARNWPEYVIQRAPNRLHITSSIITILLILPLASSYLKSLEGGMQLHFLFKLKILKPRQQKFRIWDALPATWNKDFFSIFDMIFE